MGSHPDGQRQIESSPVYLLYQYRSHDLRKSRDLPMRLGERYGEIEYRGSRFIQRWRGSSGNVCLSHLAISFLVQFLPRDAYA